MNAVALGENQLFDELVKASGLASVFASAVVARACTRAGLDPRTLKRGDLTRALPALEQALGIYLPQDEVKTRLSAIESLVRDRSL
jgi:hypothetical protein